MAELSTRLRLPFFIASICALGYYQVNDGDLGFHLATGREILHTGAIPSHNVLSFSEPEHAWLLHQWLPALIFEWAWQHAGLYALMALKLLLLAGCWLCVSGAARRLGASPLSAAGAAACAATASAFRFELRPYLFTHLTLACAVFALATAVGAPERRRGPPLWAAGALALGCQLHAGAIDTALILGLFSAGVMFEPWRARWAGEAPRAPYGLRPAGTWLGALALGLGVAALALQLYHPLGARVLSVPFSMATDSYFQAHLVEFRAPWALPFASLAAYWGWLAAVLVALISCARRTHAGVLLCVIAYVCISLSYSRMAFAFGIVSAPLVARALTIGTENRKELARSAPKLVLLIYLLGPVYVYRDHEPGVGLSPWVWPAGQFSFIRVHTLAGRAFVSDVWGGPFLGEFYPERRVFFDNRLEAYSPQFAREVYQRVRYGAPGWDALLDRYAIEFLLLRYTTPGEAAFQRGAPNLRQQLAHDARYRLVHFDDVGELFVRANGANAALAARMGIPGVDPDRHTFVGKPALAAPALLAAAERGETSLTLLGMTALALDDAGDSEHARSLARALEQRAPDDPFVARVAARVGHGLEH